MKRWRSLGLTLLLLFAWVIPAHAAAAQLVVTAPADGATVQGPVFLDFLAGLTVSFSLRVEVAHGKNATVGFRQAELIPVYEGGVTTPAPGAKVKGFKWDATGYSGGPYTLLIQAVDPVRETVLSQGTVSFVLDAPDLSPKLDLQMPDTASGTLPISVSIGDNDLESWELVSLDAQGKQRFLGRGGPGSALPASFYVGDLPDGLYTYRLTARDTLANESVLERKVLVKNAPPSPDLRMLSSDPALIDLPVQYTAVSPVRITLSVLGADGKTEVAAGRSEGPDGTGVTANVPVDLSGLRPGRYTASVLIEDAQQRKGGGQFTLTVSEPVAPPVLDELPAYSTGAVRLHVTLPDGVAVAGAEVTRTHGGTTVSLQGPALAASAREFVINDRPEAEGEYTYRAVLVTADGRRAVGGGRITIVDREPPALGVLSVAQVDGQGLNMRWTAATDAVGLKGYEIYLLDGDERRKVASLTGNYEAFSMPLAAGEYAVVLAAVDGAGHRTESAPVPFRVMEGAVALMRGGRFLPTDVPGLIEDDRTWVPLRLFSETLGYKVIWNDRAQTASIFDDAGGRVVSATVGQTDLHIFYKDGREVTQAIPVAPRLVNDRVLVPLRALAEALGAEVRWHAEIQTVELIRRK